MKNNMALSIRHTRVPQFPGTHQARGIVEQGSLIGQASCGPIMEVAGHGGTDRSATCTPTHKAAKSVFEDARSHLQSTAKLDAASTVKSTARKKLRSRERKRICWMAAAQAASLAPAKSPAGDSAGQLPSGPVLDCLLSITTLNTILSHFVSDIYCAELSV